MRHIGSTHNKVIDIMMDKNMEIPECLDTKRKRVTEDFRVMSKKRKPEEDEDDMSESHGSVDRLVNDVKSLMGPPDDLAYRISEGTLHIGNEEERNRNEKPYQCKICGAGLSKPRYLTAHMQKFH